MSALTVGDRAYARLPIFQRKVEQARIAVESAARKGRVGLSFSGGKDSTVLLDLVRSVIPGAPAAFFDSGMEYPETYAMVVASHVETVQPERSLPEMLRYGGYWGHEHSTDPEARFDFFAFLVGEPARRFVMAHELDVLGIGLRAQESAGRRMRLGRAGALSWVESEQVWHFCPLARWSHQEVWSYIASRGLRYNAIYDRMADAGIPREDWRVSTLLGLSAASQGRLAFLRQTAPEIFRLLAVDFPSIVRWT